MGGEVSSWLDLDWVHCVRCMDVSRDFSLLSCGAGFADGLYLVDVRSEDVLRAQLDVKNVFDMSFSLDT